MRIGIVGPCGAGKTTLATALEALGYDAHDCAQEHSEVQTMWQRIGRPDILIYLDASLSVICRRLNVGWEQSYIDTQKRRLKHARSHAHFRLDTDTLTREQVRGRCLNFLSSLTSTK